MRVHVSNEQIRAAFEAVKDDPSFNESRALWDQGRPPAEMIRALCLRPQLLASFAGFGGSVYPGGVLERRIKELVIIESSRRNACQFCAESHAALVKLAGIEDDPIHALQHIEQLSPRERLAIEYTRAAMTDSNRVSESLFNDLRNQFSDAEIVELTFLIGFINMLNLFNNCLQVRYNDDYAVIA